MKAHELGRKLLECPNDEVLIWDPDGTDWFPVTNWTYIDIVRDQRVVRLYSDDDYLPDDSPWKAKSE